MGADRSGDVADQRSDDSGAPRDDHGTGLGCGPYGGFDGAYYGGVSSNVRCSPEERVRTAEAMVTEQ
jgi:hypothetical protein